MAILRLTVRPQNHALAELQAEVAEHYLAQARPKPRLAAADMMRLSSVLMQHQHLDVAEKFITIMLKNKGHFPHLADSMTALANAFSHQQELEKALYWRKLSTDLFPNHDANL